MFIGIDIGNTNATIGLFDNGTLVYSFKVETGLLKSRSRAFFEIRHKITARYSSGITAEAVYISSVVPSLNTAAIQIFKKVFDINPEIIGKDITVPLINRYRIPSQVGQDRLVSAYAAFKIYGPGLIIVDFGTAITFDVLSKKIEYLGGLITPGLKIMQEALHKKTALLPYVELARPIENIGRDTVASIRAGLVFGVASLCDGIIERLLKKDCKGFRVIATGGDAMLVKPYSAYLNIVEEHLILKGLYFIHCSQKNIK